MTGINDLPAAPSARRISARVSRAAAVAVAATFAMVGTSALTPVSAAAKPPPAKPKVASLTLSPSPVGHSGGTVHLHAVVKHAASCKVSISPHLAGLPKTHSCSSGHLSLSFHVGSSTAIRHFTLTLKASKGSHHASKSVHLTQNGVLPSASSFSASPASLPTAGGTTTLTASVSHGTTCTLSASPAVTGLPAAVACSGTSYSHQVTLPANTSATAAAAYIFTLQVIGAGGSTTVSTHPVVTVAAATVQPGGGGGTPPTSATPITATSASSAQLPSDANTGANDDTVLNSVSCPAADDCVAVGDYDATYNSTGDPYIGLIETYNGTTWTATKAPSPSNAYTTYPATLLNSVSCASATYCVAVGEFDAESGGSQLGYEPYIAVLSGGGWTVVNAATPTAPTYPGGDLKNVSCAGDGTCVAVGDFANAPSQQAALIEQNSGGSWSSIDPQLPNNADSSTDNNYLNAVSCTGANACTAVGGYVSGGDEAGLGEVLASNVWSPSQLAPTADLGDDAAVSCSGTSCAATGEFNTNHSFIQTVISGSWTDEIATPLPNVNTGSAELYAIDCANSSSCVGAGSYYTSGSVAQGLLDYGSGTAYTAQQAPLPASPAPSTGNPDGQLRIISCGTAGACVAAGSYDDTSGTGQPLLETESDPSGTPAWAAASPATPGGGTFLSLDGISCFGSWGCVAVGDYENSGSGVSGEVVLTPS